MFKAVHGGDHKEYVGLSRLTFARVFEVCAPYFLLRAVVVPWKILENSARAAPIIMHM